METADHRDTHQSGDSEQPSTNRIRLVVDVDDLDRAIASYRDQLGLSEEFFVDSGNGARVIALRAGRATLELVTPAQRRLIDELEGGPPIRVAFEVTDVEASTTGTIVAGAEAIAPPTETPWGSRNARLNGPGPIHLTLFQELE